MFCFFAEKKRAMSTPLKSVIPLNVYHKRSVNSSWYESIHLIVSTMDSQQAM